MPVPVFTTGEVLTAANMNAVGLWKVASGTLSLTTTPNNVTGVFSSTYKNYRVLFGITARSTTNRIDMKYLVGTTPTSSGYYQAGLGCSYAADTVIYFQRSSNDAQFFGQPVSGSSFWTMEIATPNISTLSTLHTGTFSDRNSAFAYSFGGEHIGLTAFTGFQLFTSTGTATVEYQVFGYRD